MQKRSYRILGVLLGALALILGAGPSQAGTPQTIVIDGVNDFDPSNLIDADGGDTEFTTIDIGNAYVTNDAVKLYIGLEHDQMNWTTVQIGIAIDVNTAAGGTTDPWGRQLEWSLAPLKPDFMFYTNLDNQWQAGLRWNGAAWENMAPAGPGSLGWATGTGFKELAVLLSTLGVSAADEINVEMWITQDGGTKGPLDAVANDASQLSTPDGTVFDVDFPIPMIDMINYTVQAAADPDPPIVTRALHRTEAVIDLTFNEPVDETTAGQAGNYALSGGNNGVSVTGATRDAVDLNIVHLALSADITASANLYTVTVTGVEDLAGNPITVNGVDNVACFFLKNLLFRGQFGPYLQNNSMPPDQFSIEGDILPLTFDPLCDTGLMTDTGTDDIWEFSSDFCIDGDCQTGTAAAELQWKFAHNCTTYEPLAQNRTHTISSGTGAQDILEFFWADEDPTQFTAVEIDVEFFVDMNLYGYLPGDVVALNGSVPPLNFDIPATTLMADDGVGVDAVASDGIFSKRVRFPVGSPKNVNYKFVLNDVYECSGQGDRHVYLNDELFDIVGGPNGPLTLPVGYYDHCTTIWRDVEVHFFVNMSDAGYMPGDVVAVNGTPSNTEPPVFNWDIPSLNPMADDGVAPDAVAGDLVFSKSVTFPAGSNIFTEYKYLRNGVYEDETLRINNRTFFLDPAVYDAVGNPQVLATDFFGSLAPVGVPELPGNRLDLAQNQPNPFNPATEIHFSVPRAGIGSLRIYDLRGQLIRTLLDGELAAGPGSVTWQARGDDGQQVSSGVYFYRLEVGSESVTRSMVLLK